MIHITSKTKLPYLDDQMNTKIYQMNTKIYKNKGKYNVTLICKKITG